MATIQKENSMLTGKTFISTRPAGKAKGMQQLCQQAGATLVDFPLIEVSALPLKKAEAEALQQLSAFDWLVFTSANGVHFFFQHLKKTGISWNVPNIAVIGAKTDKELLKQGVKATFTGQACSGEAFVEELKNVFANDNPRLLWPTGNLAPDIRTQQLQKIARVTRINVYQNQPVEGVKPSVLDQVKAGNYDLIFLYSPSAIQNLQQLLGNCFKLSNLKVACIGPTTEKACHQFGLQPLVVAQHPGDEALLEAATAHYSNLQS